MDFKNIPDSVMNVWKESDETIKVAIGTEPQKVATVLAAVASKHEDFANIIYNTMLQMFARLENMEEMCAEFMKDCRLVKEKREGKKPKVAAWPINRKNNKIVS